MSEEFEVAMKRLAEANQRITELEETVERLEQRLDEATKETDSRSAKIERVIDHARRKQRNGGEVVMDYSDVMAAAGVSAPTAYDYMKTLSDTDDAVRLLEKHTSPSGKTRIVIDGSRLNGLKHNE